MENSKYEVFLKVIEKGSFSAAAEELGYTPSGLNRMMSALEQDMGFPLFHRTKKGVGITSDGERVLPAMEKIVYWERQLREEAGEICGLETGNINIGAIYSIASVLLPDMIQKFKESYPGITVQVLQGSHQELNDWFEEGKVDLIFTSRRELKDHWITIKKDPLIVWVSQKSEMAGAKAFSREDFEKVPLILTMPGQDTDSENLLRERGIPVNMQYSSQDNYTSYRMVEAGLGVSVNNLMMAQNWDGEVAVLPFDPPAFVELGIRYPEPCPLSARKFCELAQQVVAEF